MVQALQAADTDLIAGLHSGSDSGYTGIDLLYSYTLAKPAKVKQVAIPGKDTSGRAAFDWMQTNTNAGVISICHMGDVAYSANVNYSLAVFLAGATPLTYFGASPAFACALSCTSASAAPADFSAPAPPLSQASPPTPRAQMTRPGSPAPRAAPTRGRSFLPGAAEWAIRASTTSRSARPTARRSRARVRRRSTR